MRSLIAFGLLVIFAWSSAQPLDARFDPLENELLENKKIRLKREVPEDAKLTVVTI